MLFGVHFADRDKGDLYGEKLMLRFGAAPKIFDKFAPDGKPVKYGKYYFAGKGLLRFCAELLFFSYLKLDGQEKICYN